MFDMDTCRTPFLHVSKNFTFMDTCSDTLHFSMDTCRISAGAACVHNVDIPACVHEIRNIGTATPPGHRGASSVVWAAEVAVNHVRVALPVQHAAKFAAGTLARAVVVIHRVGLPVTGAAHLSDLVTAAGDSDWLGFPLHRQRV